MSKHTPGPWKARYQDRVTTADDTDGTKSIAHIYGNTGDVRADQALVAAAPELLEALKNAQSRLCEHCPQYIDSASEQVGDHTDECIAAMDAIDKAEGRS